MGKKIQAIVRGPENYFDGQLFAPGQVVMVDEDFVSDEDFIEKDVEVTLKQPVMDNGKLVRTAIETVKTRTRFRPIDSDIPRAEQPTTTAEVATAQLDRLNVNDFLKGGADDIEEAIANGTVDDHLGVIEQAEISGKGRKGVKAAVAARRAALSQ